MNKPSSLTPFFEPKGVVVIGASNNPAKLGYRLAHNLKRSHYEGAIHFVNIKGGTLLGKSILTSVAKVPDPVDLAVVLIPSKYVPSALKECGQRGIHAAIIGSGGFRETGPEGAKLEASMLQVAREYGIRLPAQHHLPPTPRPHPWRCCLSLPIGRNLRGSY